MADEAQEDDLERALRELLRAGHDANLAIAHHLGLGLNEAHALDVLGLSGPLGPVELGERLGMRSASATALVDRLEAAGHVERVRDPADRRRVAVVPTEHAQAEALRAMAPLLGDLGAALGAVAPADRPAVARFLREVTGAMRRYGATRGR